MTDRPPRSPQAVVIVACDRCGDRFAARPMDPAPFCPKCEAAD